MNINGYNEQWKVTAQFKELNKLQTHNKNELRDMLLKSCCHLLPEELWDIILELLFNADSIVAYFEFKRNDKFYMDDHYMFSGSEKGWRLALAKMSSNVNPFDLYDDIPTDTYCSGVCELIRQTDGAYFECPDEKGNKCECHWTHRVFSSENDFNAYYYSKKRRILWSYNAGRGKLWSIDNVDPTRRHSVSPAVNPAVNPAVSPAVNPAVSPFRAIMSHPHCPGIVKMPKK
jgi:hypothetical protein